MEPDKPIKCRYPKKRVLYRFPRIKGIFHNNPEKYRPLEMLTRGGQGHLQLLHWREFNVPHLQTVDARQHHFSDRRNRLTKSFRLSQRLMLLSTLPPDDKHHQLRLAGLAVRMWYAARPLNPAEGKPAGTLGLGCL